MGEVHDLSEHRARREGLTPPGCDLKGLRFMPLDITRLLESDLLGLSTGDEFKAAVTLWAKSWLQVPAASMPDDERLLARAASVSLAEWRAISTMALRGWVKCADGRLYHPVVAAEALKAWGERLSFRERSAKANAARHGSTFDPSSFKEGREEADRYLAALKDGDNVATLQHGAEGAPTGSENIPSATPKSSEGTGTGTGTLKILPVGAQSAAPDHPKEAWQRARALLTGAGAMKAPAAGKLFGRILAEHHLTATDLLPAIVKAETTGTADPAGYLTAAARRIGSSKTAQPRQSQEFV